MNNDARSNGRGRSPIGDLEIARQIAREHDATSVKVTPTDPVPRERWVYRGPSLVDVASLGALIGTLLALAVVIASRAGLWSW